MSDLRKHLEAEREKHRAVKYPGDLGIDILVAAPARIVDYADRSAARAVSIFKIFGALGALAAAAVLALVVWFNNEQTLTKVVIQPTIETPQDTQEEEVAPLVLSNPVSVSQSIDDVSI